MRILLVNTRHYRGGGDSSYTFNLAELLTDKGHEIAFFAMQDDRNLHDMNSDLFVSHIDFREVNRDKSITNGLRVLGRVIYSTEARSKFSQILDRFAPDIVHLQNIHSHLSPSIIFEAKHRGIPVVWTLHDYKLVCPNTNFLDNTTGEICEFCASGRFYQAALRRCKKGSLLASAMASVEAYAYKLMGVAGKVDAFLSPSLFLKNKLADCGFPTGKVHHLPLFLPQEMCRTERRAGSYLLFASRLDPIKGIHTLIEACRLTPGVKVVLAGRVDEPLASELAGLLPANASYVGLKHGKDLIELFNGASAVVSPSLCFENQPFSILEAFSFGKPVIASSLGGMVELVEDRERGLLFPAGDAAALAAAMEWVTLHPAEAEAMGESAHQYVTREHSPGMHYERMLQVYREVLASG